MPWRVRYNGWGGYTTYGTFEYPYEHAPGRAPLNLSDPDHALRRAYKRSYNTPLVTRDYRAVNTFHGSRSDTTGTGTGAARLSARSRRGGA